MKPFLCDSLHRLRGCAPASTRSQSVDFLRGLCVIFVILLHVNLRIPFKNSPAGAGWPKWAISDLFRNGHYGVVIFFVVSGYLITTMSLRRWGSLQAIRPWAFYRLRAARIAPLLIVVLTLLSILHLSGAEGFVISPSVASLPRALLSACSFHLNWLEAQRGYLPGGWDVLWSLSVEECFYLLFPLAGLLLRRAWALGLLAAFLVAFAPFAREGWWTGNELWQDKGYLASADAIVLGCAAACLASRLTAPSAWRWAAGLLGAAMISLTLFVKVALGWMHLYAQNVCDMTSSFLALGVALALWAQAGSPTIRWTWLRILTLPLRVVGRSSYEIYLTHMFVVTALFGLYARWGSPIAQAPAWHASMLLLSIILGVAVDRLFSAPINRRLRASD